MLRDLQLISNNNYTQFSLNVMYIGNTACIL